jgi:PAS domain S-box-containing protein
MFFSLSREKILSKSAYQKLLILSIVLYTHYKAGNMENTKKNSILIVDDEKINLEVLNSILSPEYNIYMTKSGVSALDLARNNEPNLILLDIIMPDMSGFDVLAQLKSSEKTRHIPVIIITGLNSNEDEEKGLALGAADFIHKPLTTNIVKARVRNQIQIINQIHAIEESAKEKEAIVDNHMGVIWSVDNTGKIISFNGQYLKSIGISPTDLVNKNIEVARAKNRHPDIIDNIEKTFREKRPQDWQSEVDGVIFRSHTEPLPDKDGNIIKIVGSSDNITELVMLHRQLEASAKAAESANRTKSIFLAKMSHEIRTPLNAVLGISEIQLQNEALPQDVKEAFTRIFNSGDLLLGIINDILDMSKIEAGKMELTPARYDVSSVINDIVFLNMIKYESKPIEFNLQVGENIPSELIGDELRIKQILNNLLSNAFKYTKAGEVELSINAEDTPDSGGNVTLIFRVRDTGQGMTPEQIGKLFEEYSRFNLETNRMTEGTGLGMGITQNLIHMMNGEISAESEVGKGSLFTVRLPQGNTGAPILGKEGAENLRQFRIINEAKMKKIQIVRKPIPFGKVLVVDDMEMNLYVSKGMLSPYGLQIDTALSGPEAIEKIKHISYDLVFMDHMMPVMDGIEATREIRKLGKEYETLPIVALTANAVSGVKEMFLANGFDGFLSKPISAQGLDDILKEWMSPEKITQGAKAETADADKTNDSFLDDIGKISEINAEIGLNQLSGDKNTYRSTLEIFHKRLIPECNNMASSLDLKDLNNFMVSVHAMKSMLAIIGALTMSEAALDLETASKNNEIDFCTQRFPKFKEKLLSLHRKLFVVLHGEQKETEPSASATTGVSSAPPAAVKFQAGKVLIVDDMEMLLFVIKEKLLPYGLDVDMATSGREAIDKIRNDTYNLVFMDHLMPEMDGIEATLEIRKLGKEYEKLPVIALTANTDSGVKEMFLANGFNGFLSKPVVKQKLEEVLKEWLPVEQP